MAVVVMGLDGACWNLIQPWLQAGELPNLAALIARGATGPLQVQMPPVTAPNWKCYSTGRNPGQLGVFWWERIDWRARRVTHPSALSFRAPDYWSGLSDRKVAVINMPTTYPPQPVPGWMVSGHPVPRAEEAAYTWPAGLQAELEQRYDYRIYPTPMPGRDDDLTAPGVQDTLRLLDLRLRLALDLLTEQRPDLVHVTTFDINILQHFFYQGEPTRQGWRRIDAYIGAFMDLGVDLVVMSDHGCAPIERVFFINQWLRRQGYLHLHADRLAEFRFQSHAQPGKAELIDWERSLAVASSQGPVYVLKDPADPGYADLRRELAAALAAVRDPVSGQTIATRVYRREEVWSGPYLDLGPDLILAIRPGYDVKDRMDGDDLFATPVAWRGGNAPEGLVALFGPRIRAGVRLEGASILDLAPTVLHLLGEPAPPELEGRVLDEALAD